MMSALVLFFGVVCGFIFWDFDLWLYFWGVRIYFLVLVFFVV